MMKDTRGAHRGAMPISAGEMTAGYGGLIIALAAAFAALYVAMYVGFPLLMELFVTV
jgi:hypothetical protein